MLEKTKSFNKIIKFACILSVITIVILISGYIMFYYTQVPLHLNSVKKANVLSKSDKKSLLLCREGNWERFIVSGVTLEDTISGGLPDKENVTYDMYMEWFSMIGKMNANTIQVRDIMETEFYKAFYDYNRNRQKPLYLLQGITLKKEAFNKMKDAFSGKMEKQLRQKAYYTIDTVHGSNRGGKPSYTWNISNWVLAYVVGGDWDKDLVLYTNDVCADRAGYDGKFISTVPKASAFETVLAKVGDEILSYEAGKYGEQRLLGYANWLGIDPLAHNASCFLNLDSVYSKYMPEEGKNSFYRGYLEEINKCHKMPVVISGLGVPVSKGISIRNFNEGKLNEEEQGALLQNIYNDIINSGCAGGCIIPWSDAQVSAQPYGLLAIEPGKKCSMCYIDGDVSEWKNAKPMIDEDGNQLQMMYDEKYVYFHIKMNSQYLKGDKIFIPLDIAPNSGTKKDITNGLDYDRNMDFVIVIDGENDSKILVQEYYKFHGPKFGKEDLYIKKPNKESGQFEIIENIGLLHYGNSNPKAECYDSLADFIISGNDIEIRIPWTVLNFSDPSNMMIYDDYYKSYSLESIKIKELYAALTVKKADDIIPMPSGKLSLKGWGDSPSWHTRLKKSYYYVQDIFGE